MWNDALTALLFFLPAGIANAVPVLFAKMPFLKNLEYPMDFNLSFKGKRILGDHKTLRGLIGGILCGIAISALINAWYNSDPVLRENLRSNFGAVNVFLFGFLSALGALFGDALKSFFKRRTDIKPGVSWFPFDQIDYILGGCILTLFYVRLDLKQYLWIFIIYFGLHLLSSYIGFLLKLKAKPI